MSRLMVLLVFIFSNGQEYFNITRQPSSQWVDLPDVFRIPPSQCNESKGVEECTQMGGRKIGDCQCDCNITDDRGFAYKSTFGFYRGKWKCVNNSLLRKQAGCLQLSGERDDDPIKTLSRNIMNPASSNSPNSLTVLILNNSSNIPLLAADNSSYLNCEGKWESFNGSRRFHQTSYSVKFNNESDRWEPRLEGRIIKVGVLSMNRSSVSCLLLKLDGHQICAEPPLSSSSSPSSAVATPTLSVSTPTSTSCGSECKTTPTPPSELHKMIIMVLLGGAILGVIIVASVLMKKISRRNTRRKRMIRQPFVPQMSALSVSENYEYDQSLDDQARQEDGYLYPIDNYAPRDKRYEFDKLNPKEMDGNAERVYMEESGSSKAAEKYKNTNSYRLQNSITENKSSVEKLHSVLENPSSGGPSGCNGYKPSTPQPDPNNSESCCSRNINRSKEEPIYNVLEDPRAYSISSSTSGKSRNNTLQNQRYVSMETNQGNKDYVYNEAGQIIIENSPQRDQNYQELKFDGPRSSHVYQSLCIAGKKSKEKGT